MGYFDSITTENGQDIVVDDSIIESGYYQSKDFMYDEDGFIGTGDCYTITKDGYIYFSENEKKNIKITGLCNIYLSIGSKELDYYLLIEQNKIIAVYRNVYFEDLPKAVKILYNISFNSDDKLDIDSSQLSCKLNKRRLKKTRKHILKRKKIYSPHFCKTLKTFKRKLNKKGASKNNISICVEKYNVRIYLDESHSFIQDKVIPDALGAFRGLGISTLMYQQSIDDIK